jgi:hypothetical protein
VREDFLIATGCTQVSEILYSQGASLAGLLPKALNYRRCMPQWLTGGASEGDASEPDLVRRFSA